MTIVGPGRRRARRGWPRSWPGASSSTTRSSSSWLPCGDPAAVPDAVAVGIGLREAGPLQGDASAGLDRLVEHLADRPTIVVMDNCEHVIGESARVVEQLLVHCPLLRVLATSREALGLGGETIWPVPPLAIEDAVALFTDRAERRRRAPTARSTPTAVVEDVCTRLDGLPLAIELAAARVRVIPVQQLADRLDDRFRLLTGGARTALPRQQTLRAVVEWSYDLLFDDERRVFELLSVFAGGARWRRPRPCAPGTRSRPRTSPTCWPTSSTSRWWSPTTSTARPASTCSRRWRCSGGSAWPRRRRRTTPGTVMPPTTSPSRSAGPAAFRGDDQVAWLAEIARESDNLRAALAWFIDQQDAEAAHRLVGGMGWTWWMGGNGEEGLRWFDAALSCHGSVGSPDPGARARLGLWGRHQHRPRAWSSRSSRGEEAVALLRDVDGGRSTVAGRRVPAPRPRPHATRPARARPRALRRGRRR